MTDFARLREERKAKLAHRIERQSLSVVAIHHVPITKRHIEAKLAADPHWTSLTMGYLIDITRDLYLIDIVTDDLGVIDAQLFDVTQENEHGQAPWGERYFNATGDRLLDDRGGFLPPSDDFAQPGHVRFFMHYFDPSLELTFGEFVLDIPWPTPLPVWLGEIMPYVPPN